MFTNIDVIFMCTKIALTWTCSWQKSLRVGRISNILLFSIFIIKFFDVSVLEFPSNFASEALLKNHRCDWKEHLKISDSAKFQNEILHRSEATVD